MWKRRLAKFIKQGRLTIVLPNGDCWPFGDGHSSEIVVRVSSRLTLAKLLVCPDLYLGEAYMDGSLQIEQGDLWDFLDLIGKNIPPPDGWKRFLKRVSVMLAGRILQSNSRRQSCTNVAHHYDLSNNFYASFLGDDLQYSCAYFRSAELSLSRAQEAKKSHIIAKLLLQPGQTVLDIGSGWGGLALAIAQAEDVRVTGITLSQAQLQLARKRAYMAGLADRVQFELKDYRDIDTRFDRVVSVGMFEHVGAPNYNTFFKKLREILTERGIALIHSIGRSRGPELTSAWVRKYIFPRGYIPALSQVFPHVERSGLWVTDVEILRLHYAETLRAWRSAFLDHGSGYQVDHGIADERFRRMWEFYLAISEMSFRYAGMMVFQMQLSPSINAVPLTRDYIARAEGPFMDKLAAE